MDVLNELRTSLSARVEAEASARHRYHAGLEVELPLTQVSQSFPDFAREENFAAVRERLHATKTPESERPGLKAWLGFLARCTTDAKAAQAEEEIAALEAQQPMPTPQAPVSVREVAALLSREPTRERRVAIEAALSSFLLAHRGPYLRRTEAAFLAAEALGFEGTKAMRDALERVAGPAASSGGAALERAANPSPGLPEAPSSASTSPSLREQAERVLTLTEDAYRDVLGYALKRLDPLLRPLPSGTGALHDLMAVTHAPWLMGHFQPREVAPVLQRALMEAGFHPTAEGRIRLDLDERPGKAQRPGVFPVKVPEEVRLVVQTSDGGLSAYADLLQGFGEALPLAYVPVDASVETRRLRDSALQQAYGLCFTHQLTLEGWHRRYLAASKPTAREAARASALVLLARLRAVCALRPMTDSLESRGPSLHHADEFVQRLSDALFVTVPKGLYLRHPAKLDAPDAELQAWALGGRLLERLESLHDEDFYRNPGTGPWLKSQWRGVAQPTAASLAEALSSAPLSLVAVGARLVRILGA